MAGRTSRLQRELRQRRPFASVYHEAFLSVLKTADVFRRAVSEVLQPFGVTPQQYNVLRILRGAEPEGLPTLAIADRLIEETPGMTRLLDRLEAKRLIRRARCKADRRQVLCRISPEGLRLLGQVDAVIAGPERRLSAAWTPAEASALVALLDRARAAMAGSSLPDHHTDQRSKRLMQLKSILTLALVLSAAPAAFAQSYTIDGAHSKAQFSVRHMMVSNVRGEFTRMKGAIDYDEKNPAAIRVEATIEVASINTGEPKRDEHLKSPDFFDAAKYPTITFRSKSARRTSSGLAVTGDLTIHGVTKEVVLQVEGPSPEVRDPWGNLRRGATATTKINRKDFGLTWNAALETGGVVVGDEVSITIDVEAMRPAARK